MLANDEGQMQTADVYSRPVSMEWSLQVWRDQHDSKGTDLYTEDIERVENAHAGRLS